MFCAKCGKSIDDDAKFCGHCGAPVAAAATGSSFTPPPASSSSSSSSSSFGGSDASATAHDAADALRNVNPSGILARVKAILLSPKTEWPVIAAESRTSGQIIGGYVVPLVILSALASFIGLALIGTTVFGVTVRTPIGAGIVQMIMTIVLTVIGLYIDAMIINALAPTFGGQKDSLRALKVAAYSFTAAWVASLFSIIPMLGILGIIGALYSLYLMYLGLPVLMRSPADKAFGYTAVVVICTIVLYMLVAMVVGGLMAMTGFSAARMAGMSVSSASQSSTDDAAAGVLAGMLGGKTDADKARMKDAMQQLQKMGADAEAAEKAAKASGGDAQAAAASKVDAAQAMAAVGTMLSGGKDVKPVDFRELKGLLPTSVAGLPQTDTAGQNGEAMGMKGSSATGNYGDSAGTHVTLEIVDLGSMSGLAGLASKFDPNVEKESGSTYERTQRIDGQLVHEQYDKAAKSGSFDVLVGNRFTISAHGNNVPPETLVAAIKSVDTSRLAALAH
ncbi:MAG: YIP1 family protein [Proteobacteria bacterium]|nr:YIP1 family protein [Pseudomonadota bacterium]